MKFKFRMRITQTRTGHPLFLSLIFCQMEITDDDVDGRGGDDSLQRLFRMKSKGAASFLVMDDWYCY